MHFPPLAELSEGSRAGAERRAAPAPSWCGNAPLDLPPAAASSGFILNLTSAGPFQCRCDGFISDTLCANLYPFYLGLYLSGHLLGFSSSLFWFGFKKRCCVFICWRVEPGCPRRLALIHTFQLFWFQYLKLDASTEISIAHWCFFMTLVKK